VIKSYKHPLAAPLDELVQEDGEVRKDEPAYVKSEELGRVPCAQLQAHLRLVGVSKAGIFHLSGYFICGITLVSSFRTEGRDNSPTACAASNSLASAAM